MSIDEASQSEASRVPQQPLEQTDDTTLDSPDVSLDSSESLYADVEDDLRAASTSSTPESSGTLSNDSANSAIAGLPGLELTDGSEESQLDTPEGIKPPADYELPEYWLDFTPDELDPEQYIEGFDSRESQDGDNSSKKPVRTDEIESSEESEESKRDVEPKDTEESEPLEESDASDSSDNPPVESTVEDGPRTTRESLTEIALGRFEGNEAQQQFIDSIEAFERRADKENLPVDERERFYGQVERVLTGNSQNGNFSHDELQQVAQDMMRHAADPGTVNQGSNPSCTTASMESALYKQEPATVAKFVADLALDGKVTTNDGSEIKPPPQTLKPSEFDNSPEAKRRTLANQIAQIGLIDVFWNRQETLDGNDMDKTGQIFYEEHHPPAYIGDSGTRLMDYSSGEPQPLTEIVVVNDPTYVEDPNSPPLPGAGTERPSDNAPSMQMEYLKDIYEQLQGNMGRLPLISINEAEGVQTPKTFEEFKQIFEGAHEGADGLGYPMLLGVFASEAPFIQDLRASSSKPTGEIDKGEHKKMSEMHSHHAVAAFGYDPETETVIIENQWGQSVDHTGDEGEQKPISIRDLYSAYAGSKADFDGDGSPDRAPEIVTETDEKKPTPEEYIEEQSNFIDELEKDGRIPSEKILEEMFTLHHYQDHWGKDTDANSTLDRMLSHYQDHMAGDGELSTTMAGSERLARLLYEEGREEDARSILRDLDRKTINDSDSLNRDSIERMEDLEKLHEELGDQDTGGKLVRQLVDSHLDDIDAETLLDGSSFRSVMRSVDALKTMGKTDESTKVLERVMQVHDELEKNASPDDPALLQLKLDLAVETQTGGHTEIAQRLTGELKQSYERQKAERDENGEEIEPKYLPITLAELYSAQKNPDALLPISNDILESLAAEPGQDGASRGRDSREMIGPITLQADLLLAAGANEKSMELFEEALKLSIKHRDGSEMRNLTTKMVNIYDRTGQSDKADRILESTGIEMRFRRRM